MAYDDDRILLWTATCFFLVISIASIYWFYVHYYKKESSSTSPPQANEPNITQTQSGAAQHQVYQGSAVQSGHQSYELEPVRQNPQRKTGGEAVAGVPVATLSRPAARDDSGSYHPDQASMNIISPLSKEDFGHQSENHAGDQQALRLATDGRRHYSVTDSDSSGTPQMTPKTGSSAASTPDGPRTPLPRYTLEPCVTNPPVYAESEPGHHASSAPPRRPTF